MKTLKISLVLFVSLLFVNLQAQDKQDRPSPPESTTASINGAQVTIDYSSPAVKDRIIWGDLVPYGVIWRTGANEATTLTTDKDIEIEGKTLKAGKYSLFTIPDKKEWTFIINSVWDQWGDYNYDASKDVMRFTAVPYKLDDFRERLNIDIDEGRVDVKWAELGVGFTIK